MNVLTANAIRFNHYRNENMLIESEFITDSQDKGELSLFRIKQIMISKESVKEYVPYGNQKSFFLPTGMVGPTVKLVGSVDRDDWDGVYTNDYLEVVQFGYTMWSYTLAAETTWWIDNISFDAKPGGIKDGNIRYGCTLDLYKRTVE